MRVDFSSRNPYSDGAEWKWRLKDKDDHVIEGARERFGKVGKVIGEDFGNIKGNVGIEMNKIKAYCRSFSGGSFKGNAIKILKDSGSTNFFDAKVLNNIILCIFASDKKHKHSHRNVWVRLTFN